MPQTAKLLALSNRIATKARALIPRSSNRTAYGAADPLLHATNSQWSNAPAYVQLQLAAQRASSASASIKELRLLIDELNFDLSLSSPEAEAVINHAFLEALKNRLTEWNNPEFPDLNSVVARLKSKTVKRAFKTHHKPKGFSGFFGIQDEYTAMEKEEADAKNAVRYKVGNCGENASLALVMFAEYPGPNGDATLPDLDPIHSQRPRVEKIAATGSHDHAFVVINRPAGNLNDTSSWFKNDVIICDPWWFHAGGAIIADDRSDQLKTALFNYISGAGTNNELVRVTEIRLGQGHSEHVRSKPKYNNLNYYENSAEETKALLRH